MIKCTECDAEIKIPSDAMENEIVTCPDCGASYELIKSNDGFAIRPAQSVGNQPTRFSVRCTKTTLLSTPRAFARLSVKLSTTSASRS